MLRRVKAYIQKHKLLNQGDKVLVALSGGADSVALLDILLRLGYNCLAVHCNFHLRGEESDRDENFVRQLCTQLSVPLIVQDFQTADYARQHSVSIEMAARELRYNLFEQLRCEHQCTVVAVAHHQNDQAETLLINLIRGTGIRGLAGMKPRNSDIIRPLLCTTHQDILSYLTLRQLPHVEDSTNTDTNIQRNLIRHHLSLYPESAVTNMADTADIVQGYSRIIDAYISSIKSNILTTAAGNPLDSDSDSLSEDEVRINIPSLLLTPAPQIILYELLRPYSFPQTDEIYSALLSPDSGMYFYSPTHTALKDRQTLVVYPTIARENIPPRANISIRAKNKQETYPKQEELRIIVDSKITEKPITFRHYLPGDRFSPIGMKSTKKLQDFLTDLHLSRKQKQELWLMLSGDEIAWVVGYRISEHFKVTSQTKQIAEITICNTSE